MQSPPEGLLAAGRGGAVGASGRELDRTRGGGGSLAHVGAMAAECSGAQESGKEQGGDATVQGLAALGFSKEAALASSYPGGGRAVRGGDEESWRSGAAGLGRGEECGRGEWDPSDADEAGHEALEALEGSFADHHSDACSVASLYSRTRSRCCVGSWVVCAVT